IRDRNVTGVQTCALPIFEDASAEGVEVRFRECETLFIGHLRQAARKIGQTNLAPLASDDEQERTESGADRSKQGKGQAMQYPRDGNGKAGQQDGLPLTGERAAAPR